MPLFDPRAWAQAMGGSGQAAWDTRSTGSNAVADVFANMAPSSATDEKGWAIPDAPAPSTNSDHSPHPSGSLLTAATQRTMAAVFAGVPVTTAGTAATAAAPAAPAAPVQTAPQAISVDVESEASRKAQVSFTVLRAAVGQLTLGPIAAVAGKSRLSTKAARLSHGDEGVRIQLKIFGRQAPGVYCGNVTDAAGDIVGTLRVVVVEVAI